MQKYGRHYVDLWRVWVPARCEFCGRAVWYQNDVANCSHCPDYSVPTVGGFYVANVCGPRAQVSQWMVDAKADGQAFDDWRLSHVQVDIWEGSDGMHAVVV